MADVIPAAGGGNAAPIDPRYGVTAFADETAEEADRNRSERVDAVWRYWMGEIAAQRDIESRFRKEGQMAWNRYYGDGANSSTAKQDGESNLAWSIINALRPIYYSERPDPIVRRRFGGEGEEDPTDSFVAEVAQRVAQSIIDQTDFHDAMEGARDDWLISGRGDVRVSYHAEFENTEMGERRIRSERVEVEYWPWFDQIFGPCPSWSKCPWIAYPHYMDRVEVAEKFGEEIAAKMTYSVPGQSDPDADPGERSIDWNLSDDGESKPINASTKARAEIYEIWWKKKRQVIWISPGYRESHLKIEKDPFNLVRFFDCPKPLLATTKGQTLTPRPDMAYYQHQIDAIDKASKKLEGILDAIKVMGFYPGSKEAMLNRAFKSPGHRLHAVTDWVGFMEKGGINNMIHWVPIQQFVEAAQALQALLEQRKTMLFETSGVTDAMRGAADPTRTATGEQIQGRYAGLRTSQKQQRMAHFALDTIVMAVELVVEQFTDESLAAMTQIDLPWTEEERKLRGAVVQVPGPAGQMIAQPVDPTFKDKGTSWELVRAKLRDDLQRAYSVQIETDSTILEDETEDRQARIEFLTVFAQVVNNMLPMIQAMPNLVPVAKGFLLFAVRGFRKARMLEHLIEGLPDEAPPQEQDQEQNDGELKIQLEKIKGEIEGQLQAARLAHESEESSKELGFKEQQGALDRAHEMRMKGADIQADAAQEQIKLAKDRERDERQAERDDRRDEKQFEREEMRAGRADARADGERLEGYAREDAAAEGEQQNAVKDRLMQALMDGMEGRA